jgi:hypothetical protein
MLRRDALSEYVRGSLWVLPTLSVLVALAAGSLLSVVSIGSRSPLAFQGTADDARALLIGIAGTMVTVIALLLGLTVVALQLSSTQFSPRLLRNFLRDRPNQIVLSAFVATFAYSAAGLSHGRRSGAATATFPAAVTGALVPPSAWPAGVLRRPPAHPGRCDHTAANTIAVIRDGLFTGGHDAPEVPAGSVDHVPALWYAEVSSPDEHTPPSTGPLRLAWLGTRGRDDAGVDRAPPRDSAPDPRVFAARTLNPDRLSLRWSKMPRSAQSWSTSRGAIPGRTIPYYGPGRRSPAGDLRARQRPLAPRARSKQRQRDVRMAVPNTRCDVRPIRCYGPRANCRPCAARC